MNLRSRRLRLATASAALLAATLACNSAHAGALYTFLVIDPVSTAGAGVDTSSGFSVTSTRSGAGTWHLYAVDDLDSSFGIRSFFVKLNAGEGGLITSVCNRTPDTVYATGPTLGPDSSSGFNDVRGVYDTAISGGQSPLNTAPIGGLGVTASNFGAQTPGQSFFTTTSGQWGVYADPYTSGQVSATGSTRSAVLLGEGSYAGAPPTVDLTTPMGKGGTGFNTWTNAGTTRSDLVLDLSSSNPFNCPACATGNDPNLVSRAVVPEPPQIALPPPPPPATLPVAAPAPPTGSPPVASTEPDPATQPYEPTLPPPILTVPPAGGWGPVFIGDWIPGEYPYQIITMPYQQIDKMVYQIPDEAAVPNSPHGLQSAMITALSGLRAAESFVGDGAAYFNGSVTSMWLANFAMLDAGSMNQVLIDSAAPTPEPATLALVGLAVVGGLGVIRRRT